MQTEFHHMFAMGSKGNSGGITLWKEEVNVRLLRYYERYIDVEVTTNQPWRLTGVYGTQITQSEMSYAICSEHYMTK